MPQRVVDEVHASLLKAVDVQVSATTSESSGLAPLPALLWMPRTKLFMTTTRPCPLSHLQDIKTHTSVNLEDDVREQNGREPPFLPDTRCPTYCARKLVCMMRMMLVHGVRLRFDTGLAIGVRAGRLARHTDAISSGTATPRGTKRRRCLSSRSLGRGSNPSRLIGIAMSVDRGLDSFLPHDSLDPPPASLSLSANGREILRPRPWPRA